MADPDTPLDKWIEAQPSSKIGPSLSVIIPAFNERWRIPPTLIDIVDHLDKSIGSYEVIVVDDGSNDDTQEIVKKFERVREQVKLIRLPKNMGKGHAVKVGVLNARGQRVLFADADGSTPIEELSRLMRSIDEGADVAVGSRAKASNETHVRTVWYRKLLGRLFNKVVNLLVLPGIEDTQCGFKLFTKRAAEFVFNKQTSDGFSFDVEILYLAQKAKFKIAEVPVNWENVPGSKVNLVVDALKMFRDVFRFKVIHRNIKPVD